MGRSLTNWQTELLERGGLTSSPMAGALADVAVEAAYRTLLRDALTAAEVAELLRVGRTRVRRRRADRTLFAVRITNEWLYPDMQFTGEGPHREQIRGLERVLPVLPASLHPLSVAGFLTTPQPGLIRKGELVAPLEWLSTGGDSQPVLDAAHAVQWAGL